MDDISLIRRRIENARKRLIDLSLRNRFLNYRVGSRAAIEITDFDPDSLYNVLVQEARSLTLLPQNDDGLDLADLDTRSSNPTTTKKLRVKETEKSLENKLLRFYRESRTIQEEQGINLLFLALGLLQWFEEDGEQIARYAPMLLIPITIERTTAKTFTLSHDGTEIVSNLSMIEKAKEFGIRLPEFDQEVGSVSDYFSLISAQVSSLKQWKVIPEYAVIGFFNYAKYVMFKDLDENNWKPGSKPEEHEIVQILFGESEHDSTSTTTEHSGNLDEIRPVKGSLEVYDADSSQLEAIVQAKNAKLMIIEGPPGTGKSQTITNLIAEAVYEGKKVLFVAEKRAALEVVVRRLDEAGLSQMSIELHSSKASKRAFYESLKRTMENETTSVGGIQHRLDELEQTRMKLNQYCVALHTPLSQYGVSPYQCVNELIKLGVRADGRRPFRFTMMKDWDLNTYQSVREIVQRFEIYRQRYGVPVRNPFWGSELRSISSEVLEEVRTRVKTTIGRLQRAEETLQHLRSYLELDIDLREVVRSNRSSWEEKLPQIRLAVHSFGRRWYRFAVPAFLIANIDLSRLLRRRAPMNSEVLLKIVDSALSIVEYERELEALCDLLQAQVIRQHLSSLPYSEQMVKLEEWNNCISDLEHLVRFNCLTDDAQRAGVSWLADLAKSGAVSLSEFDWTWYQGIFDEALSQRPVLRECEPEDYADLTAKFKELDNLLLQINRLRVAEKHASQIPRYRGAGNLLMLQREIRKQRAQKPVRRIMSEAGAAVLDIKPVFMMSPLSVALYLPPNSAQFDLVIFDEASQVKPEDALGAILRGKQVVVVGDSQQLPPTTFFDKLVEDDITEAEQEEDITGGIESILDMACTALPPKHPWHRLLRWHYRSKHHSLIECSNRLFYRERLVIPPSNLLMCKELGVVFHPVPEGVYERGRSRTNRVEASKVADAIIDHLKHSWDLSLGVAAFSVAQQHAIEDELEMRRRQDPALDTMLCEFDKRHLYEPLFIKNLETIQGDERDVIFISVGYSRDEQGSLSMNFGPLNKDGGERRLNVLITRARHRCEVFSGIRFVDLRVDDTLPKGVRALYTFLRYAETGDLDEPPVVEKEPMSPFEEDVLNVLREWGYEVRPQVGTAGFYVDIGVVNPLNPAEYILGVECDGAQYHSSRSARDRDRLRQQILEQRGWQIHRIWSTSWYRNNQHERQRLKKAVEDAINRVSEVNVWSVPKHLPEKRDENPVIPVVNNVVSQTAPSRDGRLFPNYRFANITKLSITSTTGLSRSLVMVAMEESPVHIEELIRRIREAGGYARAGSKIRSDIMAALRAVERAGKVIWDGEFVWIKPQKTPVPRNRSNLPPQYKKIEYIHPEELRQGILYVVKNSYGIEATELVKEVIRMFGFERTTSNMLTTVQTQVESLISGGKIINDNGVIRLT